MPFADDPVWLDGRSYSSQEMRRATAMMLMADGTAGGSRGGVRPGDPGLLVTLAGMTITVAPGVCAVPYTGQGVYRAYSTTSWTGTVTTAHASLDRIDLVYLRVWDNTVDGAGLSQADIVYLPGTAGSGSAPAPSGTQIYIPLATITVPASSTTPSVTDARPTAIAPGGIALGSTAGLYPGQYRDNAVTGLPDRWSGTAWVPSGAPVSYTPAWTITGTPRTANTQGRYMQVGRRCTGVAVLTYGTGTESLGPGPLTTVSLPIRASAAPTGGALAWVSSGVHVASGTAPRDLRAKISPGADHLELYGLDSSGGWGDPGLLLSSYHWSTGSAQSICFDYEV